ncbi:MAG: hypothetical protein Q8P02_03810, partial [Candidatus Micrarchaeota archaeon]|nr:hypothetical protein [Candidatus Micrarchaeota archaeon]
MNVRVHDFFRPTWATLFVLLALLTATFLIPKTDSICSPGPNGMVCNVVAVEGLGYPLFFGDRFYGDAAVHGFFADAFALNLLWAYVLACLLVFAWNRR